MAKILVIDDEAFILEMNRNLLDRLGHEVVTEINSNDALTMFADDPLSFDLIMTDQSMKYPNMNGIDLIKGMLKINPDMNFILCSGSEYGQILEDYDGDDSNIFYLAKPYDFNEFTTIINNALKK